MPAATRRTSKKIKTEPTPNFDDGIKYWESIPASVDGVLGGFGHVSRIDSLSSRTFLLSLIPRLSKVPSSIAPLNPPPVTHRTRALDVGAGIGRVTANVLIHLVDTVEVLEPAPHFLAQAVVESKKWKGLEEVKEGEERAKLGEGIEPKAARFWEGGLSGFDPSQPGKTAVEKARRGMWEGVVGGDGKDLKYDVIMCQWCLGHLSTSDLIEFFKTAKRALIENTSPSTADALIMVKENLCPDEDKDGEQGSHVWDEDDSSLTRSDKAWRYAFEQAGLTIVRNELQQGFPEELFPVGMYALR